MYEFYEKFIFPLLQVTEIDGALCQDFFTVLNLSQYYGEDHMLNVHSFSVLRSLLHATLCRDPDSIATSAVSIMVNSICSMYTASLYYVVSYMQLYAETVIV